MDMATHRALREYAVNCPVFLCWATGYIWPLCPLNVNTTTCNGTFAAGLRFASSGVALPLCPVVCRVNPCVAKGQPGHSHALKYTMTHGPYPRAYPDSVAFAHMAQTTRDNNRRVTFTLTR